MGSSLLVIFIHEGSSVPLQARTGYSALPRCRASENIERKASLPSCSIMSIPAARKSAVTNQPLNRRSLTVHCKSFTVSKDKCKINPQRTKQLKKYIMKQLARSGGEQERRAPWTILLWKGLHTYVFLIVFNEGAIEE